MGQIWAGAIVVTECCFGKARRVLRQSKLGASLQIGHFSGVFFTKDEADARASIKTKRVVGRMAEHEYVHDIDTPSTSIHNMFAFVQKDLLGCSNIGIPLLDHCDPALNQKHGQKQLEHEWLVDPFVWTCYI